MAYLQLNLTTPVRISQVMNLLLSILSGVLSLVEAWPPQKDFHDVFLSEGFFPQFESDRTLRTRYNDKAQRPL